MNRQWSSFGLFVVLALGGVGCGDDDRAPGDAGTRTDGFIIPIDGNVTDTGTGMPDAGRDMGAPTCAVGRACDVARGCNPASLACQEELAFTQGGPMDEPVYLPDGGTTSYPGLYFQDGYCTNAVISSAASREGMPGACILNPEDDTPGMDGCPACAKCISLGPDRDGNNIVQCYQRCEPTAATNPCRDGYTCDFGEKVCIFGCQSDQECQLYRADTNMNGEIEREGPMGGPSPDRLTLDIAGGATCSATTGRCTQPGTAGVSAGVTCERDSQCEQDGRCLTQFEGGYCTKFGCDVLGCAGAGKCLDVGGGTNICSQGCKIADDPGDAATGVGGGDDDCRDGYACFWDGTSTPAVAINGGCLPGNYNDVTTENIGASCIDPDGPAGDRSSDEQCWSPYGLGRCIFSEEIATCSILGCSNLPADACGTGNACVSLSAETSICLRTCTAATDCSADMGRAAYGCTDLTPGDMDTTKHCFPGCSTNADCNTGYECNGASATALGACELI